MDQGEELEYLLYCFTLKWRSCCPSKHRIFTHRHTIKYRISESLDTNFGVIFWEDCMRNLQWALHTNSACFYLHRKNRRVWNLNFVSLLHKIWVPTSQKTLTVKTLMRSVAVGRETHKKRSNSVLSINSINNGWRQGDALSTILFNLVLEAALLKIDLRGNISTRTKKLCAYADDVVIIARTQKALKETFITLKKKQKNWVS